jgi:hypothetical protein
MVWCVRGVGAWLVVVAAAGVVFGQAGVPRPRTGRPAGPPGPGIGSAGGTVSGGGATSDLKTEVVMELLTGREGVGLQAQKWSEILPRLNVGVTIRRGLAEEELETSQEVVGRNLRRVKVVGRLERDGTLVFVDRQFKSNEADKLAVWVRELTAWGAQGSTEGRALWGLSKEQFGPLFSALQEEFKVDVRGKTLGEALGEWKLETIGPVEFSSVAKDVLNGTPAPTVVQMVQGISRGTALAIVLSEVDLGFAPKRMAEGTIRLEVVTRKSRKDVWPVGWPPDRAVNQIVPNYFKFTEINIDQLPYQDVVETAGELMGTPVFVDRGGIAASGIDLDAALVSHPAKKTTWSIALKTLSNQVNGRPEILMDEAGTPFLWIKAMDVPVATGRGGSQKSKGKSQK